MTAASHPPPPKPPLSAPAVRRAPVDWAGVARVLGLVVLTVLCYWPSLRGGFLWDDDLLISHDPLVQSFGGLRRIWFSTEPYDYFPLTYTSFWLEWPLWGTDPLGYRAVNLLLHLSSAFLFWRLLTRLRVPGAWLGAVLFAVHPVNVASVAWIAERKNALSLVFYLTSLLCWAESEDQPPGDRRRARWWYAGAIGAFVLAALSKSSVVMLPCVLLLLGWWRKGNIGRQNLRRAAPFFGVSLAAGLLTVWFQFHRSMDPGGSHPTGPALLRVLIAGRSILFYLGKTLLPVRLSMIYPRWEMSVSSAVDWLPLALVLALLFGAWWGHALWGRGPFAALGYFVLTVLPVSGLMPMTFAMYSFVSDHFVYVPMLGLLAGLAAGLATWRERPGAFAHRAALVVTAAVVCLFVAAARERADEFGSSRRLWEETLRVNPRCTVAHNNLGLVLEDDGHLPEAEAHFRRALELDPAQPEAAPNLAFLLQSEGRWRESADVYAPALGRMPDAKGFNNYGVVLPQLGETHRAWEQFRSAVRLEPAMLSARFNLYRLALAQHDDPAAADELRACLRIDPDNVPSLLGLAALEIRAGRVVDAQDAVVLSERACRLSHGADAAALATLSRAYIGVGRRAEAVTTGEQARAVAERNGSTKLAADIAHYLQTMAAAPAASSTR